MEINPNERRISGAHTGAYQGADPSILEMRMALPLKRGRADAPQSRNPAQKRARPRLLRVLVLLVAVGLMAGGFLYWRSQQNVAAATTTLDVPVTKGNLDINIESSGKVQPSRNVPVSFEAAGHVNEVLVRAGDEVKKGQPLARLDDATLKLGVQKAEANLQSAQAKLDGLKIGPSAESLASAQADVTAAQADYDKVKAGATSADIADAESELKSAQAQLTSVKAGATTQELSDAQADLASAQTKLAKVKAGATSDEIAAADANLEAAQLKMASLKAGPEEADRSKARLNVTDAETNFTKVKSSTSLNRQQAEFGLDQADRALKTAQDKYYKIAKDALDENGKLRDSLTEELKLKYKSIEDLQEQYTTALRTLQDAENGYRKAQLELEDARLAEVQNVKAAQARLDDANTQLQHLLAGATQSELADAQANVVTAQNNLTKLKAGPTASDLADAQAALTKAENKLMELKAGSDASKVIDAQASVDKARNKLESLKAGATGAELASARAKVASAQANLAKLKAPATGEDIASAQAAVVQAQVGVDEAKLDLSHATLVAPFDGTVSSVAATVGAKAASGSEAVSLNDTSGLHLDIELSESDVAKVKSGQAATLTFDAIPDTTVTGTVRLVAPAATESSSDVVTYLVQVEFNPGAVPVKVGMSTNATIRVERREGVIQVPSRAVKSVGPFKTVQVLYGTEKKPITIQVQTGATNGQMTEIMGCTETGGQCLRQGDMVALDLGDTGGTGTGGPGEDRMMFFGSPADGPPPGGGFRIQRSGP